MILVDFNQVMISNLMMQIGGRHDVELEPNLIRHMVLNSLRSYRKKFYEKYGELIICCDDKNYWRTKIFPYYKAHRKKNRAESKLDWNAIYSVLNELREDLRDNFPYQVLWIDGLEADDIIASICHKYGRELGGFPILILSSDKDFLQLQCYSNVEQYSTIQKRFLKEKNPKAYIIEHIMRGDKGDGIPNFISPDDTFVAGKRQKRLSNNDLKNWIDLDPELFCTEEMLRGYKRNEALIDLTKIPNHIQQSVLEKIDDYGEAPDRSKMFNYFISKRLKNLMDSIQDF